MSQVFYIGVDGGGTKTRVRIEDAEGVLIGQGIGGPSNIRYSVEGAWHSILSAIENALHAAGLSMNENKVICHVGMGLAGCEVSEAKKQFLEQTHPFETIQLTSDSHTACIGAHLGKDGAIIAIGTGVVGYQIQLGQSTRVGGWGFPHDDMGGGAWLGLEATRHTFQWLDHRAEKAPLVEDIFAYFNRDSEHFVTWANQATATEFARLAPIVINHSQQEEILAVRILKKAAHAIERVVLALDKSRPKLADPLPLCLVGGIAPFIEPWLNEHVRANIVPRQADATVGAMILIRQAMKDTVP